MSNSGASDVLSQASEDDEESVIDVVNDNSAADTCKLNRKYFFYIWQLIMEKN